MLLRSQRFAVLAAALLSIPFASSAQPKGVPEQAQDRAAPGQAAATKAPKAPLAAGPEDKRADAPGAAIRDKARELRGDMRELGTGKGANAEGEAEKAAQPGSRAERLRETRAARRQERQEALLKRWGRETLEHASVRAALKVHAWRMARLERAKALAEESDKPNRDKLLERINTLIQKESQRHQRKLEALTKEGNLAAAGNAQAEGEGSGKSEGADAAKAKGLTKAEAAGKPPAATGEKGAGQ